MVVISTFHTLTAFHSLLPRASGLTKEAPVEHNRLTWLRDTNQLLLLTALIPVSEAILNMLQVDSCETAS
ncbi:hypothetical protein V5799_019727 [Amblyomma americanum]|uniref:Uncharacterized protein n=1 Tax=Amblyomma americanum TaxID=6943 RepID=A0AAQ4EWD5_AMBAM